MTPATERRGTLCEWAVGPIDDMEEWVAAMQRAIDTHRETGAIVICHSWGGPTITVGEAEQLEASYWPDVRWLYPNDEPA